MEYLYSISHLELVLLPVDNDGGDLLVHEEEDSEQDGRHAGQQVHIPANPYIYTEDKAKVVAAV